MHVSRQYSVFWVSLKSAVSEIVYSTLVSCFKRTLYFSLCIIHQEKPIFCSGFGVFLIYYITVICQSSNTRGIEMVIYITT